MKRRIAAPYFTNILKISDLHVRSAPERLIAGTLKIVNAFFSFPLSMWLLLGIILFFGSPCFANPAQSEPITVAVLSFQDEGGTGATEGFCWKLSGYLMKELSHTSHQQIAPRGYRLKMGEALAQETMRSLAFKMRVRYVIRTGLTAVESDSIGGEMTTKVRLFAEILSIESNKTKRVDAEAVGKGVVSDSEIGWDSIDFRNREFYGTSFGKSFRSSVENLAALIYQEIDAGNFETQAEDEQPQDVSGNDSDDTTLDDDSVDAGATEEAQISESDEDLQQLIAQTEEVLSGSNTVSKSAIDSLRQSLERLLTALENRSGLMEGGELEESDQADSEIDFQKDQLQDAIVQAQEDQYSQPDEISQPDPYRQSTIDKISKYVDLAFNVIQKTQEMRAAFRNAQEDYSQTIQADYPQNSEESEPQEESLGEVSGVITEEGLPVEGAVISDPVTGESALTDFNGSYVLKGLPAKLTSLLVNKDGKRVAEGRIDIVRGRALMADFQLKGKSGLVGGAASGMRIIPSTVAANFRISPAQAGILKGVVRDAAGRPVPRAVVELKGLAVARTNSQGLYVFTKVPAGIHQLIAFKSGLQLKNERVKIESQKILESRIQLAVDAAGSRLNGDRILLKGAGAEKTSVLRGLITDNQRRPVVGAKVSIAGSSKSVSVRTGANGSYEIRDLRPGTYQLLFSKVGYDDAAQSVALRAGKSEDKNISLTAMKSGVQTRPMPNIIAVMAEVRGQVKGLDGRLIPYASVELKRIGKALSGIQTMKTNSKGEYAFKALPGQYELKIMGKNFQGASVLIALKARASLRKDIALKSNGSASQNGGTQAVGTGQLIGRVTEEGTGKSILNAIVSIQDRKVATDRAGNYTISGLPQGNHRISIAKNSYAEETASVSIREGVTTRRDFDLRLSSNGGIGKNMLGQLTGLVKDKKTGRSVLGAFVSIDDRKVMTDRDGNYTIGDLPQGDRQLRVIKAGYFEKTVQVNIRRGETSRKNIDLEPKGAGSSSRPSDEQGNARLTGRIVDEKTGKPILGAVVSVQNRTDATDREGNFAITNLLPGAHRISVSKVGYLSENKTVIIRLGQVSTANFKLNMKTASAKR